jgi:hypothetical protein
MRAVHTKDMMFLKTVLLAIALALLSVVLMAPPKPADAQSTTESSQPGNNCAPTDKIDGSTAEQAKQKLEAAGYTGVTGLNKGCDNVWHAQAMSNGKAVNVMVAPDGSVNQETN